MTICKQIKVKLGEDRQASVSLCTKDPYAYTKYRWNDVICPDCLGMRGELEEKHKQQMKQWHKENK